MTIAARTRPFFDLSALKSAAFAASAQWTWAHITAATFLAANGPAVGIDHSNSRPKKMEGS
ncbi:MAG: hypothetical protein RL186_195 [Pseudomonadota bacterium]